MVLPRSGRSNPSLLNVRTVRGVLITGVTGRLIRTITIGSVITQVKL
jgi:hypothetical protein